MPLEAGSKLGPYEIVEPIGKGGMGEVYRARDTKLERDVAIKVLPDELAADEERVARFEREAKLLASLNHPNIASIYGFESNALVLELVEGPTLAERIQEGPIPIDEAIAFAKQIAEALEAGHESGVIHRDLKPANVKIKEDDTVKVLDYGLAKALGPETARSRFSAGSAGSTGDDLSNSPTLAAHATQAGMIMGTAAYMSPEQARGKPVDRRADIWSFGVVIYEMLTGRVPFLGEDITQTLARVVESEPDWEALPSALSPSLKTYVERCLAKDPRQRIRDIGDVRLALEGAFETTASASDGTAHDPGAWKRFTGAFATLFLLAAGLAGWAFLRPEPSRPVTRFESPFRPGQAPIGPLDMTGDGSAVVYVGPGESARGSQLWIRNWGELDARPIPGTEGARTFSGGNVAVSPNGLEVAFVIGTVGPLRVAPLANGVSRTVVDSNSVLNAAWSQNDWIYFTTIDHRGISRVPAAGGEVEIVTDLLDGETFHSFAEPLPDGKALLFEVLRLMDGSDAEIWSMDLETRERKRLTLGNNPQYTTSGHLLFGTSAGTLMAAPFDMKRAALERAAVPIMEGLAPSDDTGNVVYSLSREGTLLYMSGKGGFPSSEFVWVTRSGEATPVDAGESFVLAEQQASEGWRLSPDGSRIAFGRLVGGNANADIWIKALPDGPVSRLTFSESANIWPQWSPDGERVTYRNGSFGGGSIWSTRVDGTGEPELLFDEFDAAKGVWSPDGEWLVLRRASFFHEEVSRDILAIRPAVEAAAIPLIATEEHVEQGPAISRDGRWLAYSSNETGRPEIFVRPFPDVDAGKWQISTSGGIQPVWAHNGRELFFANPESHELEVAEFTTASTTFQRGRVTTLFESPEGTLFIDTGLGNTDFYDVAPDDERFLMARRYDGNAPETSFVLVQNFFQELQRLVPN